MNTIFNAFSHVHNSKRAVQVFSDESPFEIIVSYEWEDAPPFFAIPEDHNTYVTELRETTLLSVQCCVRGRGIDILHLLSEKEKQSIINELTYEA